MNLPLLYWASEESKDPRFHEIAVQHTETTLKHFFRPDGTVFHAYRFDLTTGEASRGDSYCGSAPDSQWARGTCWAMYGLALAYRHTKESRYLETAFELAQRFAQSLDDELVPFWDARLKAGDPSIRDSSAAAIAICAIQELADHGQTTPALNDTKRAMLERLCSPNYFDSSSCRGLLKNGQISVSQGQAASAYTSWGDYFFMEALARELGHKITWW